VAFAAGLLVLACPSGRAKRPPELATIVNAPRAKRLIFMAVNKKRCLPLPAADAPEAAEGDAAANATEAADNAATNEAAPAE